MRGVLQCVRCAGGELTGEPGAVRCAACGTIFPESDGVISFASGEVSEVRSRFSDEQDRTQRLSRLVRETSWLEALEQAYDADRVVYATDERKADFIYFLDVPPEGRVLDLGCGLGPTTIAMAREFGEVHALDRLIDQAVFVAHRARQSGFNNVVCSAGGDDLRLPYRDGCFDAVAMNGVIEWVATSDAVAALHPRECQSRILGEVHRILKPGGTLYLATKNRFALRYLIGMVDEHTGMRLTSVLPRRIAKSRFERKTGKPHRSWLHSKASMTAMLAGIGFGAVETYALIPEFRHPSAFLPVGDVASVRHAHRIGAAFDRLTRKESWLYRMMPAKALTTFEYCFAAVAKKAAQP